MQRTAQILKQNKDIWTISNSILYKYLPTGMITETHILFYFHVLPHIAEYIKCIQDMYKKVKTEEISRFLYSNLASVRFVSRPILLCLKNVDSNFSVKVKLMTFVKPKSKNLKGKRGMVVSYTPVPIEWEKKNPLAMSR